MASFTLFAIPKPFEGHTKIIQENAIASWTRLLPPFPVLLFGNEVGVSELCAKLPVRNAGPIARTARGTPLLGDCFRRAAAAAETDYLCYVNADILLFPDFPRALERLAARGTPFTAAGSRHELELARPLDFSRADWADEVRAAALRARSGLPWEKRRAARKHGADFFVFPRLPARDWPDFTPRWYWDSWLLGELNRIAPLVDLSPSVLTVHQSHGYEHIAVAAGQSPWQSEEAEANRKLLGDEPPYYLHHADFELTARGLRGVAWKRRAFRVEHLLLETWHVSSLYHRLVHGTAPLRHRLGLHRRNSRRTS